jgi:hypothetical protein
MKILLPKLKFQIVFLLVLLISIMIRKATALLSRRLFRYSRDNRRALYDSGRKLDALKPTVDTVVVEGAYVQLTTGEKTIYIVKLIITVIVITSVVSIRAAVTLTLVVAVVVVAVVVDTIVVEVAYVQLTTGEKRARVRVRVMLGLGSGLVERTIDRARVKVVGISLGNLKVLLLVKVTVE